MAFWVRNGPVYHSENMTKLKQVLFAAGLVAVGYRLGAKSPAAAAPAGSREFRDEVAPERRPSSKAKASRCQVVPAAESSPRLSVPAPEPESTNLKTSAKKQGSLIKDCSDYSNNWWQTKIRSHMPEVTDDQRKSYFQQLQDHWAQAYQTSMNWRGTSRISIDGTLVTFDVIYRLRKDDAGAVCWDMTAYSTQPQGTNWVSGSGGCGGQFMDWINGAAVRPAETYQVSGVGELVSAIVLPMDPMAAVDFEYLGAADEKWESAGPMIFQPLSDTALAEFQDELRGNAFGTSRAPASDAQ